METNNIKLERAFRIASGNVSTNIVPYREGILKQKVPCVMAGLRYNTPWTRDAAINSWNSLAITEPEAAKNTLLAVTDEDDCGKTCIGVGFGQYWDSMIWTIGAYEYAIINQDYEFLKFVYETTLNTLKYFEENEFDEEKGLFRGAAVYGDGVAAYPDKYGVIPDNSSCIKKWVKFHPEERAKKGFGLNLYVLSTNCMYYRVYKICEEIAEYFGDNSTLYTQKAYNLKNSINFNFWNEKKQNYDYILDECDFNEGIGLSLVILFDIADDEKKERVLKNTFISPNGICCLYPTFERYKKAGDMGRHSGTVWPFIQSFWGRAAHKCKKEDLFENELNIMTEKALRDGQFYELYHSQTGEIYGGLQEKYGYDGMYMWESLPCQTWSATGYQALLLHGVCGIRYTINDMSIEPYLPKGTDYIKVYNLHWGEKCFNLTVKRGNEGKGRINVKTAGEIGDEICLFVE